MKRLLIVLSLILPLAVQAAATTTTSAAPASRTATAVNMLTQLPVFLTKLDTLRGQALTATEKSAVTNVVTKGNTAVNGVQAQFLDGIAKTSGLDTTTLSLLFPSATKSVSSTDLTSKVEGKLGSKLGFLQKASLTTANTLRNNSLDGLKNSLSTSVANKLGMDPATVTALLPLLGF